MSARYWRTQPSKARKLSEAAEAGEAVKQAKARKPGEAAEAREAAEADEAVKRPLSNSPEIVEHIETKGRIRSAPARNRRKPVKR